MKFFAAAALFAGALAVPTNGGNGGVCPAGLLSNPVCCDTLVLGLVGLNCAPPANDTPRDGRDFRDICARKGQQAACCAIPVAGQGVLCSSPVGA